MMIGFRFVSFRKLLSLSSICEHTVKNRMCANMTPTFGAVVTPKWCQCNTMGATVTP